MSDFDRRFVLLQKYIDKSMTDEEAVELAEILDRHESDDAQSREICIDLWMHVLADHYFDTKKSLSKESEFSEGKYDTTFAAHGDEDGIEVDWNRLARLSGEAAAGSLSSDEARELVELVSLANTTVSLGTPVSRPPQKQTRRAVYQLRTSHFVLAGIVLFFGFLAVYSEFFHSIPSDPSPHPVPFHSVGTVTAAVDVIWPPETEPLKTGRHLEPGRIAFESGLLELTLSNGVRLALEGPIDFQLHSAMNTFCNLGRLSATVPEKGKGFEVVTRLLTAIDLGTEFSLHVDEQSTEMHTLTGRVELRRLSEGQLQLDEGNAFRIDPQGRSEQFDADPTTFLSRKDVARKVVEAERSLLERWQESQSIWNDDPSLAVHFDFEDDGLSVMNRSKSGRQSGRLSGVSRSRGRWHGKRAVEFRRKHDAVHFDEPDRMQSMTLFASIRIDALKRFNQTLLASDSPHEGGIVWQLWNDGSIQLSVEKSRNTPPLRFNAPKAISRNQWGAWYTVCTVVDGNGKAIRHYFDGNKVADISLETPLFVQLGEATLGNALLREKNTTDRSFDGAMDQFMLFKRALTEEEIRRLHFQSSSF